MCKVKSRRLCVYKNTCALFSSRQSLRQTSQCSLITRKMTYEWINKDFITNIVAKDKNAKISDILVENIDISEASNKGDNYMANLLRVHCKVLVKGEAQTCSYIVKTTTEDVSCQEFATEMNVFPKELQMYSEVIPELEQLWHIRTGESINFGPR
jgi:Ecdysteroid kinase-like family